LLTLHVEGAITTDQFKHQNERNAHQQQELLNKKAELIVALEEGKNSQNAKKPLERKLNASLT
jgi:hypothetical protein